MPRMNGAPGEARTVLFEREFGRQGVKVLPGEFFVSDEDIVISTVLGSCVAACLWDPTRKLGGMNHFMLPGSGGDDPVGLAGRYGAFAMEQLINEMIKRGGRKASFEAKVFGGGAVLRGMTALNVGTRNAQFVEDFLRTEGIRITARDLLDVHPRRDLREDAAVFAMHFHLRSDNVGAHAQLAISRRFHDGGCRLIAGCLNAEDERHALPSLSALQCALRSNGRQAAHSDSARAA